MWLVPCGLVSGGFVAVNFSGAGVINPMPNPQSGEPGSMLCVAPNFLSIWHGWFYQELMLPPA
jgi:hypothetical protein